jgi:hypothetical protein
MSERIERVTPVGSEPELGEHLAAQVLRESRMTALITA